MFFKWTDPPDSQIGFAVLPYIKGVTEPLTRILNNNGIRATTRPVKTLQQEFASPKSRPPSDRQTNVVYKIPCSDCTWNYIGETGRCLHTRKKEHIRNTNVLKHRHAKRARVIFLVIGVFVELFTVMIWLSFGLRCTARRKLEIYNL